MWLEALESKRDLSYKKFDSINPNPDHRFIEIELLKSDNIQLLREEIIRLEEIIKKMPSITELPNSKMRTFLEEGN